MESKDKRYFFAVGQRSFEAGASGNFFSTVVPIADADGELVAEPMLEFPNRGRVWWMLRGEARVMHAPPGCLIMSGIEDAVDLSASPDKDIYQLLQPTLPGVKALMEILTPDAPVSDPNELLDDFRMRCNHEPTRHVLVRVGDGLYGPLKVELNRPENDRRIEPEIRFSKSIAPHTIYRIEADAAVGRPGYFRHNVVVQRDTSKPNDQFGHDVLYEAVTGALYEELRDSAEEVELVSLQDAVRQVARDFLSRRERREFLDRLGRFVEQAQSSPAVVARVEQLLRGQTAMLDALDPVFEALLSDHTFAPRIDEGVAAEVAQRVDAQAAQIDARAQERVAALNTTLAELKSQYEEQKTTLDRESARRLEELESELEARRRTADEELESQRDELRRQEEMIAQSLEAVAERLSSDRTGVLNDFLALEPLLQRLGLGASSQQGEREHAPSPVGTATPFLHFPRLPDIESDRAHVQEEPFFERFVQHVEECGFVFERVDLLAFHLAAKERAPLVLGGVSGSGKSSLPVLYAEALAGENVDKRFVAVDVNPSWTSPADFLGYTDALEHRFIPAASGMLHQMILAQHAFNVLGSLAPVFSVCLDELNLAQPEHYLADIMQAISRAPENQFINVFDPNAVIAEDPFRPYARLAIAPNLIIIGTVNFDETTRPLSMRLLDRCNLLEFTVDDRLPVFGLTAQTGTHHVAGQPVLQADRDRWTRNVNVPARTVDVLGEIQSELSALGCGLTQRRQTLICRFVANTPESLCSLDQALDMQLCQRVLPQIRRLYRPGAMEVLKRLYSKLEHMCDVPRTLRALDRMEASERSLDDSLFAEE